MIYLDHAATTPVRPEVREEMEPYLSGSFGNPSGAHSVAREARRAVDAARERLAPVLGCEPAEIVFTGGGTEADNLAVTGAALRAIADGADSPLVCCSAIEHPAVLEPVRFLGGVELPVDRAGVVDMASLRALVESEGARLVLVAVMTANNETGVVEPVGEVAELVHDLAPRALVHTDAVQALCWLDVAELAAAADLVAVSAHKVGGPKGVGALVARRGAATRLAPVLRGGPQEHELRPGTHNVAGIVGFAAAAELAAREREEAAGRVARLGVRLLEGIMARVPGAIPAVRGAERLGSVVNVRFPGADSEELLYMLDRRGVAASAGSACASGALDPSPVLLAMGVGRGEARGHLRFSLGPSTTAEEIDEALAVIGEVAGAAAGVGGEEAAT